MIPTQCPGFLFQKALRPAQFVDGFLSKQVSAPSLSQDACMLGTPPPPQKVSDLEGACQLQATLGVLLSQPRGSITCVQVLQQSPKGHRVDLWAKQK